jgi:hypothetical protein
VDSLRDVEAAEYARSVRSAAVELEGGRAARKSLEKIERAMDAANYTHASAREAHCWFDSDRVANDPATTAWKRLARWRQACWREARGYPIGAAPYGGGLRSTLVGSRTELAYARRTGANFVSPQVLAAVNARLERSEPHQLLDADRLWANLLSSMPLCFNLFGSLSGSGAAAERALRAWWPELPDGHVSLKFEHSPGRCDPSFLGNKSAFDVAFEVAGSGTCAILGVETKYHEHTEATATPEPQALARYTAVTERSGVFRPGWQAHVIGTPLQQLWQDHLLVLAMLQHPSQRWQQGRFVLVYPALNPSFALAAARYKELLADTATFQAVTIETLLQTNAALDRTTRDAIQARYL